MKWAEKMKAFAEGALGFTFSQVTGNFAVLETDSNVWDKSELCLILEPDLSLYVLHRVLTSSY